LAGLGLDWLQQLCFVNIDDCKNTQEHLFYVAFISFQLKEVFISYLFYFMLDVRTA